MELVLIILFGSAVLLLILSFIKTKQSNSTLEKQIDQTSFSIMDEVHRLQKQVRDIELDAEISAHEAGLLPKNAEERVLLREMIDLHRRGYSIQSIADKKQLAEEDVATILAPYIPTKVERSQNVQ